MEKKKALFVLGSPRKDGNTSILTDTLIKSLEQNFESEKILLLDYDISPCKECYYCMDKDECSIDDDMQVLYRKLKDSDLIVLSSPIFMGGITATLKAFMERTWHLRKGQLKDKIGSYIIVGRRDIGAGVSEMEEYLSRLKLVKVPGLMGFGMRKRDVYEDQEVFKDINRLSAQLLALSK